MPAHEREPAHALSGAQIRKFIQDGFVRLDRAFPKALADEGRAILWRDLPCDPSDPATWTRPVVRLGYYGDEPFKRAVNTPSSTRLSTNSSERGAGIRAPISGAFLCGFRARTIPVMPVGTSMSAFLLDSSDPNEKQDFSSWRANVTSRGRALLMLFLFSDVGEQDAPPRIKVGSHRDVARLLEPAGEAGVSHLTPDELATALKRPEALATGEAGTVYLCHPFLLHAAQMHHGAVPRFMAQPPLPPAEPFRLDREDEAIRRWKLPFGWRCRRAAPDGAA